MKVRPPELVEQRTFRQQVGNNVTDDQPTLESAGEFGASAQSLFGSVRQIGANQHRSWQRHFKLLSAPREIYGVPCQGSRISQLAPPPQSVGATSAEGVNGDLLRIAQVVTKYAIHLLAQRPIERIKVLFVVGTP